MRSFGLAAALAAALSLTACGGQDEVLNTSTVDGSQPLASSQESSDLQHRSITGEPLTADQADYINEFNSMSPEDQSAHFDEMMARNGD